MDKDKKDIYVIRMLGGFSISYNGRVYIQDNGGMKKVYNLLEMLVLNRDRAITYEELYMAMNLDENSKSVVGVLKNLIYRVRMFMKESGLPDVEYIVQSAGTYRWNESLPIEVDTDKFEHYYELADNPGLETEDKKTLLYKTISAYGGRLLAKSTVNLWAVPTANRYMRMFEKCMNEYYSLLTEEEDFTRMVHLCEKGLTSDNYSENYYCLLIESYCKLGQYKEAMEAYETITDYMYDQMGVRPSERLLGLYSSMMGELNDVEHNPVLIDNSLREDVTEVYDKALFCNFGIFKLMTQYTLRLFERTGQTLSMILFTMTDAKGDIPKSKKRIETMERLYDVIGRSLRRGDLFAKYSSTQYVVLLANADYENSMMISKRIITRFNESPYLARTITIGSKVWMLNVHEEKFKEDMMKQKEAKKD